MKLKDLVAYCRVRLDDAVGEQTNVMFPDAELLRYIAECQERMASECMVIRDHRTSDLCVLDLSAGSFELAISSMIVRVDRVWYSNTTTGTKRELRKGAPEDVLSQDVPSGEPSLYNVSEDNDYILLDKAVPSDATINLWVRRLPIQQLATTSEALEIPEAYHRKLVNGVLGYCFMKPDTETYNESKSRGYFALFAEDLESVKRLELKRHGSNVRFRSNG